MRITLVISTLSSGGAERIFSTLANAWEKSGWDITILTLCGADDAPFYSLNKRIKWVPLDIMAESPSPLTALANNIKRILILRMAIRKTRPEAVISFLGTTNVLVLAATRASGIPVVISERNNPELEKVGKVWSMLRRVFYPGAKTLVVQYAEAGSYFEKIMHGRTQTIPNMVNLPDSSGEAAVDVSGSPFVVGVGRFVPEKGFTLLVEGFTRVKDKFPDWKLVILGDGAQRQELERLAAAPGLAGRVFLPGRVKNPGATLAHAKLFVMPSLYEGFPNALCEAMAAGLPAAASDCSGGVREIVRDGIDGALFPAGDIGAMAAVMERLMGDPQECRRLGNAARAITERFSTEKVIEMWETMLQELINRSL